MKVLRCVIMRGGTSKGIFFHENELPKDSKLRDRVILDVFGSPDARQIDGLGGADILTSKVCIVSPSNREDADVDYTFGQVIIDKPVIDYSVNCGNLSSAVGPFAIDEGLVKPVEPTTKIRIYNTNTKKVLVAEVPVRDGKAISEGDYRVDGVPGTGAKIALDFSRTGGTINGTLLPTGKAKDVLFIEGFGELEVSIVDAASPTIFARANEMGVKGREDFKDLLSNQDLLRNAELIRKAANDLLGFDSPAAPTRAFVSRPSTYVNHLTGEEIGREEIDLRALMIAAFQVHKTYAIAGTICTGVAAMIEGTIVNEVLSERAKQTGVIRIGHPSGIIDVEIEVRKEGNNYVLKRGTLYRTSRRILEGFVYLKPSTLSEEFRQIRSH